MILRNISKMALPAAIVSLGLLSGIKANAQVMFNYTSNTIFDTSSASTITTVNGTILTVSPASDATLDNAFFPGTQIKLGAFVATAGAAATEHLDLPFTTTLLVTPQGGFAPETFTFHGTVSGDFNSTQVNNSFLTISDIDQTMSQSIVVGPTTFSLDLTTAGFNPFNGRVAVGGLPKFDGINAPGGTAAGGFTIHITGAPGQTTVPEPGSVAMIIGMGISGSVFLRRKRSK